jgi:hypothetical protein
MLPCSYGALRELRVLHLFHMGLHALQPPPTASGGGTNGEGHGAGGVDDEGGPLATGMCLDGLVSLMLIDASFNDLIELSPSMASWHQLRAMNFEANRIVLSGVETTRSDGGDTPVAPPPPPPPAAAAVATTLPDLSPMLDSHHFSSIAALFHFHSENRNL